MDWNAVDFSEVGYLRKRRMLASHLTYYTAIVADLFLRFFWAYTLIPQRDQKAFSNVGEFIAQ
jgi:hypothetical protein